jgi:SAM-dependent methyltransferase
MSGGFKSHYFKDLAELESRNFWFRARNKLILWALQHYAPRMGSLLEIGCGTGFVLAAIAERFPQTQLAGSEYFEEGLDFARQRVPGARFSQMDARRIPSEQQLDVIGAFDVLEHIEEDRQVLQQMFQALKPGGIVLLTVPQHRWLWSAVDRYACHVRRYSGDELRQKTLGAGFDILRSTSFVSTLLPAMYLSRLGQSDKKQMSMDDIAGLRTHPWLNTLFSWLLEFELCLIRCGINLPCGGSRLLIARKPCAPPTVDTP